MILLTHRPLILKYLLRETEWPEFQIPDDIFREHEEEIRNLTESLVKVHVEIEDDVLFVSDKWVASLVDVERE